MARGVLGHGAALLIGEETTWGTPATRNRAIPILSHSLMRKRNKVDDEELGFIAALNTIARDWHNESDMAGGSLAFHLAYDNASLTLLRHIFGSVADSGAGPFDHLFEVVSPVPTGLTLEVLNGTGTAGLSSVSEVFEGCNLQGGSLSISAGGLMVVETEVIAQTSGGLVAVTLPTHNTAREKVKHNHAAAAGLSFNSVDRPFKSMKLSIERSLDPNHEMGSLNISQPNETSAGLSLEITTLWQQGQWDAELLADTIEVGTITFTGAGNNVALFTFHNMTVRDVRRDVSSRGPVEQTITLAPRPSADNSESGVSLTITNDNALYSAN